MAENLSFSPESSEGERQAGLRHQQAKEEGLLEQARREREEPEKYGQGREVIVNPELGGVYKTGTIADKIEERLGRGQDPLALFSDIDGTFYHEDIPEVSEKLSHILEENSWGLVFVTGRDFRMVDEQENLPKADVVVGAVGTEIHVRQKDGSYVRDEEFRDLLLDTWDRKEIYKESKEIVKENEKIVFQTRDLPGALESGKVDQPPQEFKISFWIDGDLEEAQRFAELFKERTPGAETVLSADINSDSFNLDLLPQGAGKGAAIKYLSAKLGVGGIVAGDTGNDVSMLLESGHPAILVGGATKEAKTAVMGYEGSKDMASFSSQVRKLPGGQRIMIGRDNSEKAGRALIHALQQGDLNPKDARWFVSSLYRLSKKEDEGENKGEPKK